MGIEHEVDVETDPFDRNQEKPRGSVLGIIKAGLENDQDGVLAELCAQEPEDLVAVFSCAVGIAKGAADEHLDDLEAP